MSNCSNSLSFNLDGKVYIVPVAVILFGSTLLSLGLDMPTATAIYIFFTGGIVLVGPVGMRRSWRLKRSVSLRFF